MNPLAIVHTDGVCGGRVRIAGTAIMVATVERARRDGLSFEEILHKFENLSPFEVRAALEYAQEHAREIEMDLAR